MIAKEIGNRILGAISSLALSVPTAYLAYRFLSKIRGLDLETLSLVVPAAIILAFAAHGFTHPTPYRKALGVFVVIWSLLHSVLWFWS